MRYLVLSDIHGGAHELAQALTYFNQYQCDNLVLLGDLLNHGPRNNVPNSYAPKSVAEQLNELKDQIISVRGNCDSEVDSMMFNFPCNSPYAYLYIEGTKTNQQNIPNHTLQNFAPLLAHNTEQNSSVLEHDPSLSISQGNVKKTKGIQRIFLTHGHLHQVWAKNEEEAITQRENLGLKANDIVLSGHTHIAGIFPLMNGLININPGSITIPKGGTDAGFALILEDHIELRTLQNQLISTYSFIFE